MTTRCQILIVLASEACNVGKDIVHIKLLPYFASQKDVEHPCNVQEPDAELCNPVYIRNHAILIAAQYCDLLAIGIGVPDRTC